MIQKITISEARKNFYKLVNKAAYGEKFIITKYGIPILKMIPIEQKPNTAAKKHGVTVLK